MNIETASMIKRISGWARNELNNHSMKFTKQYIRELFEYYKNKDNIDIEEIKEAFWQALNTKTIVEFTRRLMLLEETMDVIEKELFFEKRITAAIRIANRDHGAWITREQVMKAANGNRLFNFTKVAAECAAECKRK